MNDVLSETFNIHLFFVLVDPPYCEVVGEGAANYELPCLMQLQ